MKRRHIRLACTLMVIGLFLHTVASSAQDVSAVAPDKAIADDAKVSFDIKDLPRPGSPTNGAVVGGSKRTEGFVVNFGVFSLRAGRWEAMYLQKHKFPDPNYFEHGSLKYVREFQEGSISGSLYYLKLENMKERYFLFGGSNLPSVNNVIQRDVILYDHQGYILGKYKAAYAKSLNEGP